MDTPKELMYKKTDEWIKVDNNVGTVGISDFAQDQLSDIVFVEIEKEVGDMVNKGETVATIESVKAAADVTSPVSGKVTAVNEEIADSPEMLNEDPYIKGWLIKIELENPEETDELMDAAEYEKLCESRH